MRKLLLRALCTLPVILLLAYSAYGQVFINIHNGVSYMHTGPQTILVSNSNTGDNDTINIPTTKGAVYGATSFVDGSAVIMTQTPGGKHFWFYWSVSSRSLTEWPNPNYTANSNHKPENIRVVTNSSLVKYVAVQMHNTLTGQCDSVVLFYYGPSGGSVTMTTQTDISGWSLETGINGCLGAIGCSPLTDTKDVWKEDIRIYPNPASSYLNIDNLPNESITIQIVNMMGQVISTEQSSSSTHRIYVGDLPDGAYFMKIEGTTERFIVQH